MAHRFRTDFLNLISEKKRFKKSLTIHHIIINGASSWIHDEAPFSELHIFILKYSNFNLACRMALFNGRHIHKRQNRSSG